MKTTIIITLFIIVIASVNNRSVDTVNVIEKNQDVAVRLVDKACEKSELKDELDQSIQALADGVMQIVNALISLVVSVVSYVFGTITQLFSSIILGKS